MKNLADGLSWVVLGCMLALCYYIVTYLPHWVR